MERLSRLTLVSRIVYDREDKLLDAPQPGMPAGIHSEAMRIQAFIVIRNCRTVHEFI